MTTKNQANRMSRPKTKRAEKVSSNSQSQPTSLKGWQQIAGFLGQPVSEFRLCWNLKSGNVTETRVCAARKGLGKELSTGFVRRSPGVRDADSLFSLDPARDAQFGLVKLPYSLSYTSSFFQAAMKPL